MNVLPSWAVDVMDVLNIISRLTLYALVSHLWRGGSSVSWPRLQSR